MKTNKTNKKNKKSIVAFIGDKDLCTYSAQILGSLGFYRLNIDSKVREIAKLLGKFKEEEITQEIIDRVRFKGYQVSQLYWINLVLASVPDDDDKKKVVIEDIMLEDMSSDAIGIFFVKNKEDNIQCPEKVERMPDVESKEAFKNYLETKFK